MKKYLEDFKSPSRTKKRKVINKKYPFGYIRFYKLLSLNPIFLLIIFSAINLIIIILSGLYLTEIKSAICNLLHESSTEFLIESIKILGAAIYAGFVAILVTNTWQQKSLSFELLKELNSPEFLEIRNVLTIQKKIAFKKGIDLDKIESWFPDIVIKKPTEIKGYKDKAFIREHALACMLYYIIRLSNYGKNGMLNTDLTKTLFSNFFAHYATLMLEFAGAIEYHLEEYLESTPEHRVSKTRKLWLRRVEDIKYFFYIMDLEYTLSDGYIYKYFPSINQKEKIKLHLKIGDEALSKTTKSSLEKTKKYATEYDLEKHEDYTKF